MCGIFGYVSDTPLDRSTLVTLSDHAQQRGRDSSGLWTLDKDGYRVERADYQISRLLVEVQPWRSPVVVGHSRLITNGLEDNQPVVRDGVVVFHNGIVVNDEALWRTLDRQRNQSVDTEVIAAIAAQSLERGRTPEEAAADVLTACQGVVACAMAIPASSTLVLFSNNGSLYLGNLGTARLFASERFALATLGCSDIVQVLEPVALPIPTQLGDAKVVDHRSRRTNLIPSLNLSASEEKLLEHRPFTGRRCTRCILPETMPFIRFDGDGVCNYCQHYRRRNQPRPVEELERLVAPYRRSGERDCIVPFSGGRDSCHSLHLIVRELGMRPITYTYDWGMVTDLGRRNISRMCAALGVENIIIADDIERKRAHIAKNLRAWLRSPHLGMVSILTAGDKHFFRHVETVKQQTGISLNLWGINPLEVTHFKAGFLGVTPDFEEKRVYSHGIAKQLRYQGLRLKAMMQSPGYFNSSLWDTLSGEYYRSFTSKSDYFHVYDYWQWVERDVDETLATYDWEKAKDTSTTWRIGDGTAAFYNYIYYTVAGFSEHDTFRSNQIREGAISREEALRLVADENTPRYSNIRWYLDAVRLPFADVVKVVNSIPRLYDAR
jgi:hypothetical protein